MLRVTEVRCVAPDPLAAAIDTPVTGWTDGGHAMHLNGWAVSRERPCVSVEVSSGGTLLRSVATIPRPDVAAIPDHASLPWALHSGFSTGVGVLGLPEEFALRVEAVLEDGARVEVGTVAGTRTKLVPQTRPLLRPIMVTCLGRSGTTLLMELLGRHPAVVVHEPHPYEKRCATYWMHMAKVAGEPGPWLQPVTWTGQLSRFDAVVPFPFFSQVAEPATAWVTSTYTEQLAGFCLSALGEFYAECARTQGKPHATTFAEKQAPGLLADLVDELCPGQPELVSIRDPRDMLCSVLAFLDGGHTVLGHTGDQDVGDVVSRFAAEVRLLAERVQHDASRVLAVRYEDLVREQRSTLERVLSFCGLSTSDEDLSGMLAPSSNPEHFERHRTSPSLAASIGRWHGEFPRLAPLWSEELEALTVGFGYQPTEQALDGALAQRR